MPSLGRFMPVLVRRVRIIRLTAGQTELRRSLFYGNSGRYSVPARNGSVARRLPLKNEAQGLGMDSVPGDGCPGGFAGTEQQTGREAGCAAEGSASRLPGAFACRGREPL
jgi:hypothetical protein